VKVKEKAVGPWAWAVRMQRDDLMISMAVLMGFELIIGDMYEPGGRHTAKAVYAATWLYSRNIVVTETLQVREVMYQSDIELKG
jgi:hypothetical protein